MNKYSIISIIILCLSCVFFYLAFLNDELTVGIAVIFPFIIGTGSYAFIAFLFIIIAFFLFSYGLILKRNDIVYNENIHLFSARSSNKQVDTKVKAGGLIMIGPIPIIFGTSKKITIGLIVVAIIFILIFYFFLR